MLSASRQVTVRSGAPPRDGHLLCQRAGWWMLGVAGTTVAGEVCRVKRRREHRSGARDSAAVPDQLLEDPSYALIVATAAMKDTAGGDPVAHARAQVHAAIAINQLSKQASGSDLTRQASALLTEATAAFERHLPGARVDLANAHYLAADMARGTDWPRARSHYEAALPYVRRDEPMLWVAVNEGLAVALIKGPSGDHPDAQERSLALYLDALTIEPPQVPTDHWAVTAQGLALTLAERHQGKNIDNWANALRWAGRAMERMTRDADSRHWTNGLVICARARIAYGTTSLVHQPASAANALQHVRAGVDIFDQSGLSADQPLMPTYDELAAASTAIDPAQWPGPAVLRAGVRLLKAVSDRRGQVEFHILLALETAGSPPLQAAERAGHLAEAERLVSPYDDEYVRRMLAVAHASIDG